MRGAAFLAVVSIALSITVARAEPVEFVFVLRDQSSASGLSDNELVRMQDRTEAECRFETNKAIAAAGSMVVPGAPGMGFAGNSQIGGALSNLAAALTSTPPQVIAGMSRADAWAFFVSCFEAKGYRMMSKPDFKLERARYSAVHAGQRLRGVLKVYDFR